jgi:hypothetical protein
MNDPPPDLQELVKRAGDYSKITDEQWSEYDRTMEAWRQRLREGAVLEAGPIDPNKLCICGLPGVHGRVRDGRKIWRCEAHRNQW